MTLEQVKSGIPGLDFILDGGLPKNSSILIEGAPGSGKTTLGVQFLYEGIMMGEPGMYITFEELPMQIYNDMLEFGWDLRSLEEQNLFRLVCFSPKILFEEMKKETGIFQQLIEEISCKRIVIDSISLYEYCSGTDEYRNTIYALRNIIHKFSLTALFIQEKKDAVSTSIPIEHYIVDGIIHLYLDEKLEYKTRTIEVTKMRGTHIRDGKHIYRITQKGISIIPTYSVPKDLIFEDTLKISTGIAKLDYVLKGGIPEHSYFLFETDSRAKYLTFITNVIVQQLKVGKKVLMVLPILHTIEEFLRVLQKFGISSTEIIEKKQIHFIELFHRHIPNEFIPLTIQATSTNNEDYMKFIEKQILPIFRSNNNTWFVFHDINTVIDKRGVNFIASVLPEILSIGKREKLTMFIRADIEELDSKIKAILRRNSDAIIKSWVSGHYQLLQIAKSTTEKISEPFVVEHSLNIPYINIM